MNGFLHEECGEPSFMGIKNETWDESQATITI
jgi:hypothetical protein